jgi:protein FAM50
LDAERKRKEDVKREKREREKKKEKERKKKEKNLLSFNDDGEEEEEDQEEEKKLKKKKCVGMNPDADKSHVPNAQNEVVKEERLLREHLAREFLEKREKQMEENLTVTFSYWSGGGGRRFVTVKQKDTVRTFLKIAMKDLEDEFRELSKLGPESMMYVKEDCIIPHELTFYELISRKARGKSGPLFRFDDKEDVRVVADATVEKEDSHPGKIFHRSWYDKNKHIFPASRWEVFDFSKDFSSAYTIHGGMGEKKAWER